ncbi:hypothetical protein [Desulfosarcina ovata]|nr:hypothetical protein [Desulfosarcina ovata]
MGRRRKYATVVQGQQPLLHRILEKKRALLIGLVTVIAIIVLLRFLF